MTRRVLIVPDKFKGSLSAHEAAGAIARGWAAACPEDTLVLLPMSDGGDGFGLVMAGSLGL
jgi:glycerate kinase